MVALLTGFKNHETYRQARHVFLYGISALRQAMDDKQIAIYRAAHIAKLPENEQANALTQFFNNKKRK